MELLISLAFLALGTLALFYVCVRDLWNATDNSDECGLEEILANAHYQLHFIKSVA